MTGHKKNVTVLISQGMHLE